MYYKEGFLLQIIIYSAIWLIDDYIGLLVSVILGSIIASLLVFALIIETIEKSKISKHYYRWMAVSAMAPLLVAAVFSVYYEGNFDWL